MVGSSRQLGIYRGDSAGAQQDRRPYRLLGVGKERSDRVLDSERLLSLLRPPLLQFAGRIRQTSFSRAATNLGTSPVDARRGLCGGRSRGKGVSPCDFHDGREQEKRTRRVACRPEAAQVRRRARKRRQHKSSAGQSQVRICDREWIRTSTERVLRAKRVEVSNSGNVQGGPRPPLPFRTLDSDGPPDSDGPRCTHIRLTFSSTSTLAPFSKSVCAAARPERPAPTTMT